MEEEQKSQLEQILGGMRCPKDSPCYRQGLECVGRGKDTHADGYVECLAENRHDCPFLLSVSAARLCRCPLRIYVAENLKPKP
jgi:hypothetical protein